MGFYGVQLSAVVVDEAEYSVGKQQEPGGGPRERAVRLAGGGFSDDSYSDVVPDNYRLIGVVVGGVATVAMIGVGALNRRRTTEAGTSAKATVLHTELVDHRSMRGERFFRVQLAIPRVDGTEIVAVATIGYSATPPKTGWTVPVRYVERFGSTTKVEIVRGAKPPL